MGKGVELYITNTAGTLYMKHPDGYVECCIDGEDWAESVGSYDLNFLYPEMKCEVFTYVGEI